MFLVYAYVTLLFWEKLLCFCLFFSNLMNWVNSFNGQFQCDLMSLVSVPAQFRLLICLLCFTYWDKNKNKTWQERKFVHFCWPSKRIPFDSRYFLQSQLPLCLLCQTSFISIDSLFTRIAAQLTYTRTVLILHCRREHQSIFPPPGKK